MDVDQAQSMIFTGSSEGELKAWRIDQEALAEGLRETENGEVRFHALEVCSRFNRQPNPPLQVVKIVLPVANLPLSSRNRVSQVSFHPTQPYLAVQSHDRSVEIFRVRTEEEVRKKRARRIKRVKEKKGKDIAKDKIAERLEALDMDQEVDDEIKLVDLFTPYLVVRASGKIRSFDFGPDDAGLKGGTPVSATTR
jgi:U3 small nucleolar RNA-associated protein 12